MTPKRMMAPQRFRHVSTVNLTSLFSEMVHFLNVVLITYQEMQFQMFKFKRNPGQKTHFLKGGKLLKGANLNLRLVLLNKFDIVKLTVVIAPNKQDNWQC